MRGKKYRGLYPFISGWRRKRLKKIRYLKYIYIIILYTETHWPKKVKRITKGPTRYNNVHSQKIIKNNYSL